MDKAAARILRGETTPELDRQMVALPEAQLFLRLNDPNPVQRTAAARALGSQQSSGAAPLLCTRLQIEKALYTRIAISEALGLIGPPAIPGLIALLGKIGANQHQTLPERGFYKRSSPLPRDIVTRTLIKIGSPALLALEKVISNGDRPAALEAIDGIGHIAWSENDRRSEPVLLSAFQTSPSDLLIQWKLIRAFQAFPSAPVRAILTEVVLSSPHPELRWEAVRSLLLHPLRLPPELAPVIELDPHPEVKKVARFFTG